MKEMQMKVREKSSQSGRIHFGALRDDNRKLYAEPTAKLYKNFSVIITRRGE
jgi:hypothetical protein